MSEALASPIKLHRPLAAEEAARADFYALLSRLFQAAPDGDLLAALAGAQPLPAEGDAGLSRAWQELIEASAAVDAQAALDEHEALFGGVGKAQVSLYAGFYAGAAAIDHPRVRIRADLAGLGLEPEDHFAAIFDAMRVLVAGGAGRGPATVEEQRRFYEAHVLPGVVKFLQAVARGPRSDYYRRVAAVATAFFAIETQSFQLD